MDQSTTPKPYLLGHSEKELIRLERQGQIFGAETRDVLRRAGISPGMRVLDIGCGVGDVSMIAAEIVGPTGKVLGIDNAEKALIPAQARAARAGYHWLTFAGADIYAFEPDEPFDAVIGRFILMHVPDAVAALKSMARLIRPRGIVAFIEMDIDQAGAVPEIPLFRQCINWITATYRKVGIEPNMGSMLYTTFRAAGLEPRLNGTCRIESGPDSIAYTFAAETLRSLLPSTERFGIATADEIDLDTLVERLHEAATTGDHCIFMPRLIGAWATTPAAP
jgi:ubiquinone/menaquinone biosynthesis C-methylase UbiE